jgi:2-iminobutanoate/2-iminopropanoate deaminase
LAIPEHPFSPAVQIGRLLFLAGQIGTDSTGRLVAGVIKAETRQAMDNIRDVLGRVGSSMDRIVKCTVMMADMAEWPAMNAVYANYFPPQFPARSAFGATGLALGARVEIECVAVAGRNSRSKCLAQAADMLTFAAENLGWHVEDPKKKRTR